MHGSLRFCGFTIKTTSLERLENQRLIEESHGNFEEKQQNSRPYDVLSIQMVTK